MTPERFRRLRRALERRQPDLTVLLAGVSKPHNFSAVLRTCDAVGVLEAHAAGATRELAPHPVCSSGVGKWVAVRRHDDLAGALAELRAAGLRLVAAHPGEGSVDFREADYTGPTALLLGEEKEGLGEEPLAAVDLAVAVPMRGLGRSLNVSVAAALVLFEAERQRSAVGAYDTCRVPRERFERTLFEWAYPHYADHCRRRGAPYPPLDDDGNLLGPLP